MARTVKEWIGKTDDSMPGKPVRERLLRIFPACYLCTRPFVAGDKVELDHKVALRDGGENRERNLRPVHKHCHATKSAKEQTDRAKVRKSKLNSLGMGKLKSRGFPAPEKQPKRLTKECAGEPEIFRRMQRV